MTCLIVRLLEGKDSVRIFTFNRTFREKQAQHNFNWKQFCVTKSTLTKKSKSAINFVLHFLDKQWNVLKIIDIRVS